MTNEINDGGPAFPVIFEHEEATSECHGMSIRDVFAAAALHGLLSIMAKDYDAFFANKLAHACYETADAMLKAREVKP